MERATAATLGFERWSWDATVLHLDDDIEPSRVSAKRASELHLAGSLLYDVDALLGFRFHSPVDMTVSQREGQLPESQMKPCFLVRGQFDSLGEAGGSWSGTRWVSYEDVAFWGVDADGGGRGATDLPEFRAALNACNAVHGRLLTAASTRAVTEWREAKAPEAGASGGRGGGSPRRTSPRRQPRA